MMLSVEGLLLWPSQPTRCGFIQTRLLEIRGLRICPLPEGERWRRAGGATGTHRGSWTRWGCSGQRGGTRCDLLQKLCRASTKMDGWFRFWDFWGGVYYLLPSEVDLQVLQDFPYLSNLTQTELYFTSVLHECEVHDLSEAQKLVRL